MRDKNRNVRMGTVTLLLGFGICFGLIVKKGFPQGGQELNIDVYRNETGQYCGSSSQPPHHEESEYKPVETQDQSQICPVITCQPRSCSNNRCDASREGQEGIFWNIARIGADQVWSFQSHALNKTISIQGKDQLVVMMDNPDTDCIGSNLSGACAMKLVCSPPLEQTPTAEDCKTLDSFDTDASGFFLPPEIDPDKFPHATATGSVVAGRPFQSVTTGVAPQAMILPVDISNGAISGGILFLDNVLLLEQWALNITTALQWLDLHMGDAPFTVSFQWDSANSLLAFSSRPNLAAAYEGLLNELQKFSGEHLTVSGVGNHGIDSFQSGFIPIDGSLLPNVLTVGATTQQDEFPKMSDLNPTLVAPGVCIAINGPNGVFGAYDGTSFSAPEVSASLALLNSYQETVFGAVLPVTSNLALLSNLQNLKVDPRVQGFGLLDVLGAVQSLDNSAKHDVALFKKTFQRLKTLTLTPQEIQSLRKTLDSAQDFATVKASLEALVDQKVFGK